VVDRINKRYGTETILIGAQQYTQKDGKHVEAGVFANAIKHDFPPIILLILKKLLSLQRI
jgi:DNA polymerase V